MAGSPPVSDMKQTKKPSIFNGYAFFVSCGIAFTVRKKGLRYDLLSRAIKLNGDLFEY